MSTFLHRIVREDEEVRQIVRANPLRYITPILFSALFILGPFFLLYPLLELHEWGVILFVLCLLLGIFLSFRTWFLWYQNIFIITDRRLVDVEQKNLFYRAVSEVSYQNIQDVRFIIKGVLPTFFHFGTLVIQTLPSGKTIEFDGMRRPEKLQAMIVRIQQEYFKKEPNREEEQSVSPVERQKVIEELSGRRKE